MFKHLVLVYLDKAPFTFYFSTPFACMLPVPFACWNSFSYFIRWLVSRKQPETSTFMSFDFLCMMICEQLSTVNMWYGRCRMMRMHCYSRPWLCPWMIPPQQLLCGILTCQMRLLMIMICNLVRAYVDWLISSTNTSNFFHCMSPSFSEIGTHPLPKLLP